MTTPTSTTSALRLLGEIISNSISKIEERFAEASTDFPSLNRSFDPDSKAEQLLLKPSVLEATSLIIAAASQLIASVRHPAQSVLDGAMSYHLSACLGAVIQSNTAEILREGGPEGLHVNEIAKHNNTDPLKLARIIRLLANHHIFQEKSPDVFAHNRLSTMLDCGECSKELFEDRSKRHLTSRSAISSLIEVTTDEGLKGGGYLSEALLQPRTAFSNEGSDSPFNIAHRTDKFLFAWLDMPGHEYRRIRFSNAMAATTKLEPATAILSGFKWDSIPEGSTIIDVGGGVGSSSLLIAQAIPNAKIVVQDRPGAMPDAQLYWEERLPEAIESGRVQLQVYDFFTPQPIEEPGAILLRFIIHDWSDLQAKQILRNQRGAARPWTRLIVIDMFVPYTCEADVTSEIAGATLDDVPEPLLPNLGAASNFKYYMDMQMFVHVNGQDRTLGQFVELAKETGWKVVHVHRIPGSAIGQCECIPV